MKRSCSRAEPEIFKPLNMAFDARGRLWVTESQEYPYAAPADRPGRDHIKILEDTDGDGQADKITTFADGLNIPIGHVSVSRWLHGVQHSLHLAVAGHRR